MKKLLFILVTIYVLSIILMPKVRLYFQVEQELEKELMVNINNEIFNDEFLFLNISNLNITSEGIKIAKIEEITIYPFIFFNYINIRNVTMQKSIQKILNMKVKKVGVTHHIFAPFRLNLNIELVQDKLFGYVDLKAKKIKLFYKNKINGLNMLQRYIKKTKDGYKIEISF